ncbi:hypothetical protein Lal_00004264 [Lupinus albus]|nr:hypothetical protein Lal_00004264 [Lupinus albus]
MPRHLISDAHEWINEIPTVPIYYLANLQPRERAWKNQRGKKTLLSLTLVRRCEMTYEVGDLRGRHRQVGSLAGAAHLLNDNTGVLRPRVQKDPKDLEKILEGMRTGLVLTLLAGLWVKSAQKLGDFEQKVSYENELSNCLKADKFDYGERGEINMSKNWIKAFPENGFREKYRPSAKARLKERNSAFHRRTALCIKSIERGFVEAFSHASSHLRIDSGLELRRVRPSRLDKNRSMCLKSVFGPMKDEVGLSVVVNGAMYERIQSLLHRPPMRMH